MKKKKTSIKHTKGAFFNSLFKLQTATIKAIVLEFLFK